MTEKEEEFNRFSTAIMRDWKKKKERKK